MSGGFRGRRSGRVVIAVLACLVAIALPASGASAFAPVRPHRMDLQAFNSMLVDSHHHHVFVTNGWGTWGGGVEVMNFDGTVDTFIRGIRGASGMALVGSKLYVAASESNKIFEIDAAASPPVIVSKIPTGTLREPRFLAFSGGRLWVSFCFTQELGVLRLDGTGVDDAGVSAGLCPRLAPSPDHPSNVLLADGYGTFSAFDSSSVPPTLIHSAPISDPPGEVGLALLPGESSFLVADNGFVEYDTQTFAQLRTYALGNHDRELHGYNPATTDAAGGLIAAGVEDHGHPRRCIDLWRPGDRARLGYLYCQDLGIEYAIGLGFSADANRLFVVGTPEGTGRLIFSVANLRL